MKKGLTLPAQGGVHEGSEIRDVSLAPRRSRESPQQFEAPSRGSDPQRAGAQLLDVLVARSQADQTSSDFALRRLVDSLMVWAPRLLRRRFHAGRCKDFSDDAIQHLLLAITEGKADHLASADETRAASWLCRVLLNFAFDQIRRSSRAVHAGDLTAESLGDMVETTIDAQRRFVRLATELRRVAVHTASPRTRALRARLIDDYFASLLVVNSDPAKESSSRNTFDQRRCRGRRAATAAWLALRNVDAHLEEFHDMAAGLGLEVNTPARPDRFV
jgi:DNA-directed RNA polymerase specialized sigma24 family protein